MSRHLFCMSVFVVLAGCSTVLPFPSDRCIYVCPSCDEGSAGRQDALQTQLDGAAAGCRYFRFVPGEYLLSDASGIRIPTGATVDMTGARFILDKSLDEDGQAFTIHKARDIHLKRGEIIGNRAFWDPGVNIAGVRITGNSSNIRIEGLVCRDVSSNAVGVFGEGPEAEISAVVVSNVIASNCCNIYVDYLQANKGPAPGSDRRDQGTVAFYYVNGWSVESCDFRASQSDGTHFFQCRNGRFVNNTVSGSTMGGYFLEGCERILASCNLIEDNGSRGVTIERDSRDCTFSDNIVCDSGREGLWMPDVSGIVITGNQFIENGRKDDGERDSEIRLDDGAEYPTVTQGILIKNNIFRTRDHQTAAILLGPGITGIDAGWNHFQGPAIAVGSSRSQ